MSKLKFTGFTSLIAALLALSAGAALAQDPVKVAPETYKVTSDNQYVRVLEVHLKPGGKSPMHSHPGYVAVALTPCRVRFSGPDGKSQEVEFKGGESSWRDAESHSVENLGTADCRVMNIEVKNATKGKKR
jgi:quercetin dioxygenase-like cupin family protein